MGSSSPKPVKAPFEQQQQQTQQQTNTYAPFSVAGTPEGQAFQNAPLDFGDETDVDPGVGQRTRLAEQEVGNRYNSAFMGGVPAYIRQGNQARELREVGAQGAYEAQQAKYLNQQGNNQRRGMVTQANLGRLQTLLPQYLQTGGASTGSGSSSGFNTQVVQPQPGFWQRAALGAIQGASGAATGRLFG